MIECPTLITLGSKSAYKIQTHYSVWLKFIEKSECFSNGNISVSEYLDFLRDDIFIDKPAVLLSLCAAVRNGKEDKLTAYAMQRIILPLYQFLLPEKKRDDNAEFRADIDLFDFKKDWKYIDLTFLRFGIDLYSCNLHWYRFIWLLQAAILDDFKDILSYRAMPDNKISGMSKQEQKFYKAKKKAYALSKPHKKTAEEHWADMRRYIEKRCKETGITKTIDKTEHTM